MKVKIAFTAEVDEAVAARFGDEELSGYIQGFLVGRLWLLDEKAAPLKPVPVLQIGVEPLRQHSFTYGGGHNHIGGEMCSLCGGYENDERHLKERPNV